jgi:hypothetical protein
MGGKKRVSRLALEKRPKYSRILYLTQPPLSFTLLLLRTEDGAPDRLIFDACEPSFWGEDPLLLSGLTVRYPVGV